MNATFLTDLETRMESDLGRMTLTGETGNRRGAFAAVADGEQAVAELRADDPSLGATLAATGGLDALNQLHVRRVVVRAENPAMGQALTQAGYNMKTDHYELPLHLSFVERNVRVVFAGGVVGSRELLRAMIRRGALPVLAIGYDASLRDRSGYADLGPLCDDNAIPLLRTNNINHPKVVEAVRKAAPDYLCVFGFSQMVGLELLSLPRLGALGMHPTKLPEGRGRAPIPWTLIKGLTRSAVTLYWLNERVDAGELADQRPMAITRHDDAATLYDKVVAAQIAQLEETLPRLIARTVPRVPQDEAAASTWPRRRPEDGVIDWRLSAGELYNWVRGLTHPYPGAFTLLKGRQLQVWRAELAQGLSAGGAEPGTVVGVMIATGEHDGSLLIACGDGGVLALRHVQWEGEEAEFGAAHLWDWGLVGAGMRLGI